MDACGTAVAVIVVNWNRKDDTLRCLASLEAVTGPLLTTFVVDNGSSDGSVEAVRDTYPDVRIIESDRNLGFAEGNNRALMVALLDGYQYVLLLNNDATVAPDAISHMLSRMLADQNVGIVGAPVCYMSEPNVVWSAGGFVDRSRGIISSSYLDQPIDQIPCEPYRTEHVTGCCMLLRSEAIRQAGLLDSRFFMYYEETEWCTRIARHGYKILVAPKARVWHDIDPSAQSGSPAIAYYMTRNHLLYLRATKAPASAWLWTVGKQVRTLASLIVKPTSRARARGRVPMMRGMRDFAFGRYGAYRGAK